MRTLLCVISIIVTIVLMDACQKAESYPPEPHISLKSFALSNDSSLGIKVKLLTINLDFTDGDGDLFTPDTDSTLRAKAHLNIYKKVNGEFVQVPDSFWKTPYNFAFPYSSLMERNGQNKTQKGSIEFSVQFLSGFPFDTIQVGCTLMDMAFHQSNEVKLPKEFVFK